VNRWTKRVLAGIGSVLMTAVLVWAANNTDGTGAGNSITTGTDNVMYGDQSGYSTTTGNGNTMLGQYSGYLTTTGSQNVFLGYFAGYANTTSSKKLYIAVDPNSGYGIFGDFSTGYFGINNTTNNRALTVTGSVAADSVIVTYAVFGTSSFTRINTADINASDSLYAVYAKITGDITGKIDVTDTLAVKAHALSNVADSTVYITLVSGVPTAYFVGTDGDAYTVSINTSDQALFAGAGGGYVFTNGDIYAPNAYLGQGVSGGILSTVDTNESLSIRPKGEGITTFYSNNVISTGTVVVEQDSTGDAAIRFHDTDADDGSDDFIIGYDNNVDSFVIGASSTAGTNDALTIDLLKNVAMPYRVAIGNTTDATAVLEVNKAKDDTTFILERWVKSETTKAYIDTTGVATFSGNIITSGAIILGSQHAIFWAGEAALIRARGDQPNSWFKFQTGLAQSTKLYINDYGQVSILTETPSAVFDIAPAAADSNFFAFKVQKSGNTLAQLDTLGIFNIRTKGTGDAAIRFTDTGATVGSNEFTIGWDNNVDSFVISAATTVGTNNAITIDLLKTVTINTTLAIPVALPTAVTGSIYTHGDTLYVYTGAAWKVIELN